MVSAEEHAALEKDYAALDAKYVQLLSEFRHVSDQLEAFHRFIGRRDVEFATLQADLAQAMRAYAARSK